MRRRIAAQTANGWLKEGGKGAKDLTLWFGNLAAFSEPFLDNPAIFF